MPLSYWRSLERRWVSPVRSWRSWILIASCRLVARYRVIFHAPVTADPAVPDDRERVVQMTARLNTLFEAWIRERPGEWWCAKRRWAKQLYARHHECASTGIQNG